MNKDDMKTFEMIRAADESNYSGIGKVLEGCVFSGGKTVVNWCVAGKPSSTVVYDSFEDFKAIHVDSHPTNGTTFNWLNHTHESDGIIYTSNPPQNKCKICGDFYR